MSRAIAACAFIYLLGAALLLAAIYRSMRLRSGREPLGR
jgi:hypothetical protein